MSDDDFKNLRLGDKVARVSSLEELTVVSVEDGRVVASVAKVVDNPQEWRLCGKAEGHSCTRGVNGKTLG